MILVTGATGQLGGATLDFLRHSQPAHTLAALVRDPAKAADLHAQGVSVRQGDYHDYASLVQAFAGVEKLLLVSSSDFHDRAGQHRNVINAAKEAGVQQVVYTSVALQDVSTSVLAGAMQSHVETEADLQQSGLTYTLLRNNLYADLLPFFLGGPQVFQHGLNYPAGQGRVPYATRRDMAEAAARVLTTAGHENQTYELAASTSYSMSDIAAMLTEVAGQPVPYHDVPAAAYLEQLKAAHVPEEYVHFLAGFGEAIKRGEFDRPSPDLAQLLGHEPTPLAEYVRQTFVP